MDAPLELKALLAGPPLLRLAVAESLTCGQVQSRIGAIPGASHFFLGGITAYALEVKVRHLGVERSGAEQVDSVSAHVAGEMALGACALFGADIALATTGYAERSEARNIAEPFAFWALAHRAPGGVATRSGRIDLAGMSRVAAQEAAAVEAIVNLIRYLRSQSSPRSAMSSSSQPK